MKLSLSQQEPSLSVQMGTQKHSNVSMQFQRHNNASADQERMNLADTIGSVIAEVTAPFQSTIAPTEMRQLALVAHNHMKPAMKQFIETYSEILKKFRITGTQTTMKMCKSMWGEDDPNIHYGLTCTSGPLGGDAQIAALMCMEDLGGIIFFVDPLSAHPHQADIDSLLRLANCGNIIVCANPSSASSMMHTLRTALLKGDRARGMIPSFFETLESPAVEEYKHQQAVTLANVIKGSTPSEAPIAAMSVAEPKEAEIKAFVKEDVVSEQSRMRSTKRNDNMTLVLSDSLVRCTLRDSLVIGDTDFKVQASMLLDDSDEDDFDSDNGKCSEMGTDLETESTLSQSTVDEMYNRALMRQSLISSDAIIDLHTLSAVEADEDDDDDSSQLHFTSINFHEELTAPFQSTIAPTEMRQLALVAHNHMKPAMKQFIETYSEILKKFRITGTQTTMKMCKSMWGEDDPNIHYGLTCTSGPLGGDAQIAALMCMEDLGGIIFFVDPLSAHPHQADIDSLLRLANCGNIIVCANPSSASSMMHTLRTALLKGDRARGMIPSFFETLESPAVEEYKHQQAVTLANLIKEKYPSNASGLMPVSAIAKEDARDMKATVLEKRRGSLSIGIADTKTKAEGEEDVLTEMKVEQGRRRKKRAERPSLSDSFVNRALKDSFVISNTDLKALPTLLLEETEDETESDDDSNAVAIKSNFELSKNLFGIRS